MKTSQHLRGEPTDGLQRGAESCRPAIIWGARGHAKVLNEFLPGLGYELVALFDNDSETASPIEHLPVFHGVSGFNDWMSARQSMQSLAGFVAIGGPHGAARREIMSLLRGRGLAVPSVTHPTAFVASTALIGDGCQILANASVCVEARLGDACIINTGASVDHEAVVGNGVHVGPQATITGCVTVGECTFVGAGAVVLPSLTIGRNVVIGAGSVVTKDIPDGLVACGNPARLVRNAA